MVRVGDEEDFPLIGVAFKAPIGHVDPNLDYSG